MPESTRIPYSAIKRHLSLNDKTFADLRIELIRELKAQNILGKKLNTKTNKVLLRQVFMKVGGVFDEKLSGVSRETLDECLSTLAQRCNYNLRRRRHLRGEEWEIIHGDSKETEPSPESRPSSSSQPPGKDPEVERFQRPVSQIMIQIRTSVNDTFLYRLKDILAVRMTRNTRPHRAQKDLEPIDLEDLDFSKFMNILQQDLQFDATKNSIKSDHIDLTGVTILNELQWRAVIQEMYYRGASQFAFLLKER